MNYTANAGLPYPSADDTGWATPVTRLYLMLDAIKALGGLAVKPSSPGSPEPLPSASLRVDVAAGTWIKSDWSINNYAGSTSNLLTASATNYLYLTDAGVLTINTTTWPASTNVIRIATVTTNATTVTAITDQRIAGNFSLGGTALGASYLLKAGDTLADPANFALGTSTGTKIGTATNQKLAFFNQTPITQQAQTVDLKDLLVNLGLMSSSAGATPLDLDSGAAALGATTLSGSLTIGDGSNVVVNTTTGTKIGTSPSQKLAFFNQTPIVQPSSTTDIKDALVNLGFLATGGATPLDTDGGDISGATATFTTALVGGALRLGGQAFATTGTVAATTGVVTADATGGGFTLTLPAATDGKVLLIKKICTTANTVTLAAAGSDTIDGSSTSTVLNASRKAIVLMAFGANKWYIMGAF